MGLYDSIPSASVDSGADVMWSLPTLDELEWLATMFTPTSWNEMQSPPHPYMRATDYRLDPQYEQHSGKTWMGAAGTQYVDPLRLFIGEMRTQVSYPESSIDPDDIYVMPAAKVTLIPVPGRGAFIDANDIQAELTTRYAEIYRQQMRERFDTYSRGGGNWAPRTNSHLVTHTFSTTAANRERFNKYRKLSGSQLNISLWKRALLNMRYASPAPGVAKHVSGPGGLTPLAKGTRALTSMKWRNMVTTVNAFGKNKVRKPIVAWGEMLNPKHFASDVFAPPARVAKSLATSVNPIRRAYTSDSYHKELLTGIWEQAKFDAGSFFHDLSTLWKGSSQVAFERRKKHSDIYDAAWKRELMRRREYLTDAEKEIVGPLLFETGELRDDITKGSNKYDGLGVEVGFSDRMHTGTNLTMMELARIHHFGTENIPARPIFVDADGSMMNKLTYATGNFVDWVIKRAHVGVNY